MSHRIITMLVMVLLPGTGLHAACQQAVQPERDTFALFADTDLLEVKISFDLTTYLKKNLKGESLDGKLTFNPGQKDSLTKEIKIKTRGIFRQQYCTFPPMEIDFRGSVPAYHFIGDIKKIKLVTHCDPGQSADDYVLREFLVYKMFNLITDTSYRVRLLRITYTDSHRERKPVIQYGFFIEPTSILTLRTNTLNLKKATLTQKHIIPSVMNRMAIFNYMIGNYDWAVPNQHNLVVLKSLDLKANQMGIAVPYDFDYSGFVNPHYALPPEETGITNIRERIFTGICRTRKEFQDEILKMAALKDDFYNLINGFGYLSQRSRRDLIIYLDEFFNHASGSRAVEMLIDDFMIQCKKL